MSNKCVIRTYHHPIGKTLHLKMNRHPKEVLVYLYAQILHEQDKFSRNIIEIDLLRAAINDVSQLFNINANIIYPSESWRCVDESYDEKLKRGRFAQDEVVLRSKTTVSTLSPHMSLIYKTLIQCMIRVRIFLNNQF